MPRIELQPQDTIDRDAERELFTKLLLFKPGDDKRILAIKDSAGSGKTALMRLLDYICKYVDPTRAVCLIDLSEQDKDKSPFELVKRIVKSLSEPEIDTFKPLEFASYKDLNNARLRRDFSQFAPPTYNGVVQADGVHVSGSAVFAGLNVQKAESVFVGRRVWGMEHEDLARQACIDAFFKDLKSLGGEQPVVLLFDSFDDRCERDIKQWILSKLVPICFDLTGRPSQFVLVLAGQDLPNLTKNPKHSNLVETHNSLSKWSRGHVEAFLKLHGIVSKEDIEFIWDKIQSGKSIGSVLKLLDMIDEWKKSA